MIYYEVIKRKSPKDSSVKYYASARIQSSLTLKQVAENISRSCTVTVHDIKAVLSSLEEQIILALQDGKSVRFGDLGSFRATVRSTGTSNKDDFKKGNITRVMVRFTRSSAIASALSLANKDVRLASRTEALADDTGSAAGDGQQNTGGDSQNTGGTQQGGGSGDSGNEGGGNAPSA